MDLVLSFLTLKKTSIIFIYMFQIVHNSINCTIFPLPYHLVCKTSTENLPSVPNSLPNSRQTCNKQAPTPNSNPNSVLVGKACACVRNSVPNSQQTRSVFGCNSIPNSYLKPNCALFYSVFFKFAAIMDYLNYESTLPDMKRTFFSDFKLYTMERFRI